MKSQWNGHALVTRTKLLGTLERAAAGSDDFSISERALYTACEFWAAVESRGLQDYLGTDAGHQLRYASIVYTAIGAHDVALALEQALAALADVGSEQLRLQCIRELQSRLLQSADPIDNLIARFAQRLH
jgi:hypothetical protein